MLNADLVNFLEQNPPILVELSIYGITEQVYESVTRTKGSYKRFRNGLDLLLDKGLNLGLKSIAMKENFHEIAAMKDFSTKLGADFRFDPFIIPAIDGSRFPIKSRLSVDEIVKMEIQDKDVVKEIESLTEKKSRRRYFYKCGAGKYEANLDFRGRLTLCTLDRIPYYDLRQGSFQNGWNFVSNLRKVKFPSDSECFDCSIRSICKICPGWLKIEGQPPNAKVDFLCDIAKLRSNSISKEVANGHKKQEA